MAQGKLSSADRNKFIERMIGYQFSDTSIIHTALHTAGSSVGSEGNKSLAMVGDAVLRLVLILNGYNKSLSRGEINNALSTIGSQNLLARAGFDNGLNAYIQKNPSQGEFISDRVMATTVEAIIGAVYIDSKHDTAAVERTMTAFGLS